MGRQNRVVVIGVVVVVVFFLAPSQCLILQFVPGVGGSGF